MRRPGIVTTVLVMIATAIACGGGGEGDESAESDAPTTSAAATGATTAVPATAGGTTVPPVELTLRVTDVRLVFSEEPDRGMRILLPAGVPSASVVLTGVPSPNRVISVCQVSGEGQGGSGCRKPNSGEALTMTLGATARGVEIVQDAASGTGPAANSATVEEVTIRYVASSRELNVRLPQIASGDAGGRPTFALTPASTDGAYRAALNWKVIAVFGGSPSSARVELLQGGSPTNQAEGGGDVRLTGNVSPPGGAAAIRVQNVGQSALVTPQLTLLLP